MELHERRKKRQKQTAEVFTPRKMVCKVLSKLPKQNIWKKGTTFCDPACGDGNFLVRIFERKLNMGHKPLDALKTIYGIDIMRDNVKQCRQRLLKMVSEEEMVTEEHIKVVFANIVFLNKEKYPDGALQYDFSFSTHKINQKDIDRWMEDIHERHILDQVELPVPEEEFGKSLWEFE